MGVERGAGAVWLLVCGLVTTGVAQAQEGGAAAPRAASRLAPSTQEPRPAAEGAQDGARALFEAIRTDDPAQAEAFFFPRDAFTQVKAIARPERYWDKLHRRFHQDIHALHATLPQDARFERLELTPRGGYVRPGEEGNRLGYWAARHAWLHYRVGARAAKLEVRVLISWQGSWYVIHLSEFH